VDLDFDFFSKKNAETRKIGSFAVSYGNPQTATVNKKLGEKSSARSAKGADFPKFFIIVCFPQTSQLIEYLDF
jgi:hypothetical protein